MRGEAAPRMAGARLAAPRRGAQDVTDKIAAALGLGWFLFAAGLGIADWTHPFGVQAAVPPCIPIEALVCRWPSLPTVGYQSIGPSTADDPAPSREAARAA